MVAWCYIWISTICFLNEWISKSITFRRNSLSNGFTQCLYFFDFFFDRQQGNVHKKRPELCMQIKCQRFTHEHCSSKMPVYSSSLSVELLHKTYSYIVTLVIDINSVTSAVSHKHPLVPRIIRVCVCVGQRNNRLCLDKSLHHVLNPCICQLHVRQMNFWVLCVI